MTYLLRLEIMDLYGVCCMRFFITFFLGCFLVGQAHAQEDYIPAFPMMSKKHCTSLEVVKNRLLGDFGEEVTVALGANDSLGFFLAENKETGSWTFFQLVDEKIACVIAAYDPNQGSQTSTADSAEDL